MASFDSISRWERYVPTLGNNRELEQPFFLRVKASMTRPEYEAFESRLKEAPATAEGFATVFAGLVELGAEPLNVNGKPIDSIPAYLELACEQPSGELLMELTGAVRYHNSVTGAREAFFARLSGGSAFTARAPGAAGAADGSRTSR